MKPTRFFLTLFVAVLVSTAASSTQAQGIALELSGGSTLNFADSYDVVSTDNIAPLGHWGLWLDLPYELAIGLEYQLTSETDRLFNFENDFTMRSLFVGLEWSYPLVKYFYPNVRVGVGPTWGVIDLDTQQGILTDRAPGLAFYALGGFEVRIPFGDPDDTNRTFWQRLTLGVYNGYGWTQRTPLTFDELLPEEDDDASNDDRVEVGSVQPVSLGEIEVSGFTWRVGLNLHLDF